MSTFVIFTSNGLITPRDPKYYFEDGSTIFLVGGRLFKIQRSLLTSQSEVFQDMFQIPQKYNGESSSSSMEGSTDQNPITIPQVTATQFQTLLLFFYGKHVHGSVTDPDYRSLVLDAADESNRNPQSFRRYLDIASLSHRFSMEAIEKWALGQFKRVMQSSARITSSFSSHTDLLEALSYSKLTSDRDLEYDVRNMAQCYTCVLKPYLLNPFWLSQIMVLYRNSQLKKEDPAVFGHLFCLVLSEGHTSSLWAAFNRDERAKLFAAQAYLTPLPSSLATSWIQNTNEISSGVDNTQRSSCFYSCAQSLTNRANQLFKAHELTKDSPLAGVKALTMIPTQRQQLAEGAPKLAKCTCTRQLLTVIDAKIDKLFTELAASYHDRLD
ncbi:The BTB (BR-C, ttk and bab)/POZ (Pox virus and Zinc finger) domain [Ceratobasidium sp. AG-Ba]|nr:The BTB (BR-C, ttk and bab)/POZ (Pox virus and Zinc finger) domain [Ceratobasidium sp. AG-Ba]